MKVVDTSFSSDAQLLFKALLGGRVATMVSPESYQAEVKEEDSVEGDVADGEVTAMVRTVWEQQNM